MINDDPDVDRRGGISQRLYNEYKQQDQIDMNRSFDDL